MKKFLITFLFIFILSNIYSLEIPLKYEKYTDTKNGFFPRGYSYSQPTLDPGIKNLKLPKLNNKTPIYTTLKIANLSAVVLIDKKDNSKDIYNKMYIDINGNNDLTDDTPIIGTVNWYNEMNANIEFEALDFKIKIDEKELPYSIKARIYTWGIKKGGEVDPKNIHQLNINFTTNFAYTGEFEIDAQSYFIKLVDSNMNGNLNDKAEIVKYSNQSEYSAIYPSGDRFYISKNDGVKLFNYNSLILSDYFLLQNQIYKLSADIVNNKMILTPTTENLITTKLPDLQISTLQLYDEKTKLSIMMNNPMNEIKIPEGEYKILLYSAKKKNVNGTECSIGASASSRSPLTKITKDSKSEFIFGEPYKPVVYIEDWVRQNLKMGIKDVRLSLGVEGVNKEIITSLSIQNPQGDDKKLLSKKYSNRPLEATYKIMQTDGEIVKEGTFEYG